jgi:uncharacterized membrane protein HdeD (DUF308 family)
MVSVLVRNWWAFVIRGILAVLFGLIALVLPGVTILSLVLIFAAYAIADGVFALVGSVRAAKQGERWGYLAFEGIVDVVAGLAAAAWPGLTVVVFIALLAAWALITGGFMLAAAIRFDGDGRGWLFVAATASLVYGALLIVAPMIGAVVLTWWIGAYALIFGIAMLVFAFQLKARVKNSPLGQVL